MNYSLIRACDIANGPGVRVSLFVSGCTHHCPGCFQPETWDFDYGQPFIWKTQHQILSLLEPSHIDGLTILGGEPLEPCNQRDLLPFVETVKREFPNKTIWVYTGFIFEELLSRTGEYGAVTESILSQLDVLVDGPFIEAKKDLRLKFCGSSNQRLIDLKKTREAGKIVLWEDSDEENIQVSCKVCHGRGIVEIMDDFGMMQIRTCPSCKGTGVHCTKTCHVSAESRGD